MNTRLALLDGLRLLAALLVVLYHYTAWNHSNWGPEGAREAWEPMSQVTAFGNVGVPLFFAISGFVILLSCYGKSSARFIGSRIGRLFPAYWVAVLLTGTLLFFLWPGTGDDLTYGDWLVNLTMIQSAFDVESIDGVYWTLWVEMRFYLLILFLMLFRGMTPNRLLGFAALWPTAAILADAAGIEWLDVVLMKQHAPLFAGGMVLFLIFRFGHTPLRWIILGLNVALSAYFTGVRLSGEVDWLVGYEIPAQAYWPIVVAIFAVLAAVTLTPAARWNVRGLALAGALTYPVYLLHQMWGWWGIGHLNEWLPRPVTLAVVLVVVLLAAYAVHRWVEQPLGRPLGAAVTRGVERANMWVSGAIATLRPVRRPHTG